MDIDDAEIELCRENRIDAFLTGQAGDTIFYSSFRSVGAIDYAYENPLRSRLLREIAASARLSNETFWQVLREAAQFGVLRRPMPSSYDVKQAPHMLTRESELLVTDDELTHPWIYHGKRIAPGKNNHIAGVAQSALFYTMSFCREQYARSVNPYSSQPIVELSLAIPTYILLTGGVSRGLARIAFADQLPVAIRNRTVKGLAIGFWRDLAVRNIGPIRDLLLNGALVQNRILDADKLADYLRPGQPFLTVSPSHILSYVAGEAWLRSWDAHRRQLAA